jgi:hypothetical protein
MKAAQFEQPLASGRTGSKKGDFTVAALQAAGFQSLQSAEAVLKQPQIMQRSGAAGSFVSMINGNNGSYSPFKNAP